MSEKTLEVAGEVQRYLNKSFSYFAKEFLNCTEHRFDIKQEVIARSGLWIAKKRYALWIINEGGFHADKLDVKGIDSVRSNYPKAFRAFTKGMLASILKGATKEEIDVTVLSLKKSLTTMDIRDIAKPTSVKGISKYTRPGESRNSVIKGVQRSSFKHAIKGSPAHVKAAINYNNYLRYIGVEKQYVPLYESEKIKWVYLKQNPLGLEEIAFRGYDDPPEVIEFIQKYIDAYKIFDRELWGKLGDIYKAMPWSMPSESAKKLDQFFSF